MPHLDMLLLLKSQTRFGGKKKQSAHGRPQKKREGFISVLCALTINPLTVQEMLNKQNYPTQQRPLTCQVHWLQIRL